MATPVSAPMALDIDVCQSSDCTTIEITDQTGIYSSGNSGGYGNPNFAISDAIDSRVYVTMPSGVQTIITTYPTLPDSAGTAIFQVTNTMLGVTGSLPDGVYVIQYQVDFNNANSITVQYDVTKTILLSCTIKCCMDKLIAQIPTQDCDCEDDNLKLALLVYGLYQALLKAGGCGNTTAVTNLLETLTRICVTSDCGCS